MHNAPLQQHILKIIVDHICWSQLIIVIAIASVDWNGASQMYHLMRFDFKAWS